MKKYRVSYQKEGKVLTQTMTDEKLSEFKTRYTLLEVKELTQFGFKKNIDQNELLVVLNEIEMILRSNLSLYDALCIVLNGIQSKAIKKFLLSLKETLKSGLPMYQVIEKYKKELDPIIIAFFKIMHFKGNSTQLVSALCDILNTKKSNRELIIRSLSYPVFILIAFTLAMTVIFFMVIPKFEYIFLQYNLQLPIYTSFLLILKSFLINHGWLLIMFFILLYIGLKILYQVKRGRLFLDKIIITAIPIVSRIYLYYELYNFFLCLKVLSRCHYDFNVAFENATLLLNNKYLLDRIQNLYGYIQGGMSIYEAFLKVNIFDDLVLSLINSAQMSSNMHEALEKIEWYYKEKFTKSIKRFSSWIEPIFLVTMMLLILWVMLAIFTPIWSMSEMINL